MRFQLALATLAFVFVPVAAHADGWPNAPGKNPCLAQPNDPGYKGQWELWSFIPGPQNDPACPKWMRDEDWTKTPGFRTQEIAMGTGMHVDEAWQVTPGSRKVIIAVLDSGADWGNADLVNKWYLNRGELANCKPAPMANPPPGADAFDVNGDGSFDMRDYWAAAGSQKPMLAEWDKNHNGMLDPEDLIMKCSNGKDDDHDGYIDDISGWDFFADDNDAYDTNHFGHGNGEARDSAAEGNNGIGNIGVCPNCTVMMVRAGDSFVTDSNMFGQAALFAVDTGASVIQEALGTINNTPLSRKAINYAYDNNVVVIASAADELSYHHNFPGTNNHTVYVHSIQYDGPSADQSTTFLNYSNCSNFGMQLALSTPGTSCSSGATALTAGQAGLLYSAALKAKLDPPLSAEEAKQLLTLTSDDIDVDPKDNDPTKYRSGPGWDWHFGYGRNNAGRMVRWVVEGRIPPEVDIVAPLWFQVLYPDRTPKVAIKGRINERTDGLPARYTSVAWKLEYAIGVEPAESDFKVIKSGTTHGMHGLIAMWDITKVPLDLDKKLIDPNQNAVTLRLQATATLAHPLADGTTKVMGEMRKGFLLQRDPDLWPGFPIWMGGSGESSPTFADIDGDGKEELIVPTSGGLIHAFKPDGTEAPGWPVKLGLRRTDNPNNPHNVRGACSFRTSKIGCKAKQDTIDPDIRQSVMMAPAIGDLDGDGKLEVVVTTWDGFVYVFEPDGSLRRGWPQHVDWSFFKPSPTNVIQSGFMAAPVLYNLDGEPGLEVICAAMDQHIYVWHADGTPMPPYPVKVSSDPSQGARIVDTPAVGDVDGDGVPDIAVGTSEIFGAGSEANEAVAYLLDGRTGKVKPGWPQPLYGLMVNVLPIVGKGVVTNPIMADVNFNGKLEINFDTISTQGWFFEPDGKIYKKMDNQDFGPNSDSKDSPAYILMNNGAMGHIDNRGNIDFVKGTAGFNFALAFAGGGKRGYFDHQLSGWDTATGKMMNAFPRKMDDWEFFNTPTIVDINNDNNPEVIIGSEGYLVHAWDYKGDEPAGWPKQTGGSIIASANVGDFNGDGLFDVAITSRDGWLFVWKTKGKAATSILDWNGFGHDPMNTDNFSRDPAPLRTWKNERPDAGRRHDALASDAGEGDIGPSRDATAGSDAADVTAGSDAADVTTGSDAADATAPAPRPSHHGGCTGGPSPSAPLAAFLACGWLLWRRRRHGWLA